LVIDVDEAGFTALVERSKQVPVVIDLWADWCDPCKQLSPVLESVVRSYGGRLILAKVDVDANPQIAAAFQVQSIPMVVALVAGQPVPLFQGTQAEPQVRAVFEELLKVAGQAGVNGVVSGPDQVEVPLPPLHQEGYAALEAGDLAAAKRAFTKALAESPADGVAKAALAQIELEERLGNADLAALVAAAGQPGAPLDAIMAAADAEVAAGQSEAGFDRLVKRLRTATPEDKEALRLRLISLFEVAGPDDPAVGPARRAMAAALF
jgi:putative thioredoxin